MDSSRLLRGLLTLVQQSEEDSSESAQSTVISVKVLRRLLSAIHFRDARTVKHCRRVGLISVGIASRLGWDKEDRRIIEIAALLHDLGKIGIPDHILAKPGKLSPDEAEFIASHHRVALNLMQACRVHPGVIEIIAQSHGLNDEDIEERSALGLAARILAVADAYDSLTSRQSYRAAFSRWEALKILDEQAGKQFDRNVVAALGRWLDGPEAAALADEKAAEVSIQVNAPIDMEARVGASQLCLIFNYLYLLETLYEAFYIVDLHRRVAIWNSGAVRLFQKSTASVAGKPWRRGLVCSHSTLTDPMEAAFTSGQPQCHRMKVVDYERGEREVDVQSLPVFGKDEQIIGVAELVCDVKQSKQNRGQFRSLQMAATRDALTNVFNRGELENKLNELHANWSADPKQIFSVVFIDLDHFKQINDR
ncbi:MAG: HD domain-containing protein, partial [Planctomycetaceae bacterium]|nr:HD domain-containing protein [Planctomycetaceae bacterium]